MVNTRRVRGRPPRLQAARAPVPNPRAPVPEIPPPAALGRSIDDLYGVMERIAEALAPRAPLEPPPIVLPPPPPQYIPPPPQRQCAPPPPPPRQCAPRPRMPPPAYFPPPRPVQEPHYQPHYPPEPYVDANQYNEFLRFNPPTFDGCQADHLVAKWIAKLEKIFTIMRCTDEHRLLYAVYLLEEEAEAWWKVVQERWDRDGTPRTWENFIWEFEEQYVSSTTVEQREEEFVAFKQGSLSVNEFVDKFDKLARRAPHLVMGEVRRTKRFLDKLNDNIRGNLISLNITTYPEIVHRARLTENGLRAMGKLTPKPPTGGSSNWQQRKRKDWGEGSQGRKAPPKKVMARPPETKGACVFCGGRNHSVERCWKKLGKCLRCGSSEHIQNACPRPPPPWLTQENKPRLAGRAYALAQDEIPEDASVVRGFSVE